MAADPAVTAHYQNVARSGAGATLRSNRRPSFGPHRPERVYLRHTPLFRAPAHPQSRCSGTAGGPLRDIESLHQLLTATPLRTLPLWLMSSDAATETIARLHDDGSGGVIYVRGLSALANRDYSGASAAFTEAVRRGLSESTLRPMLAYSLAIAVALRKPASRSRAADPPTTIIDASGRGWRASSGAVLELRARSVHC